MVYKWIYKTPEKFDDMLMNSDGKYLTGLCFLNSKDVSKHIVDCPLKQLLIFKQTSRWLDIYFSGQNPDFIPEYKIDNITPFRREVIDIMNKIPFGCILTYSDISKIIAKNRKIERMSSQAVGGAVGWNPICIIIPCHRVVGTNGNLTGYGGGIKNKFALLNHEKNDMSKYFIPQKGSGEL